MQKTQEAACDKVQKLLAATPSPTTFVPLRKLKQIDSPSSRRRKSPSPIRHHMSGLDSLSSDCHSLDSDISSIYSSQSMGALGASSLREVIQSLEERIKEDQQSGSLGDDLSLQSAFSADICSWNKKVSKKYKKRARPPVNIMGCHQSAELIIARADERIRRQVMAHEVKERHMEEVVNYIQKLIETKLSRGEKYKTLMETQQKQLKWSTFIKCIKYAMAIEPLVMSTRNEWRAIATINTAARKVQRRMTSWYERRILMRYVNFLTKVNDKMWRIRLQIQILQKRVAVRVIKTFMAERNQNREVSKLIHTFLGGIRRIQNMARDFISCKVNRVRALCLLWDDLETQYIQSVLAKKKAEVNSVQQSSKNKDLVLDEQTRIEMDKQSSRWQSTDKKFAKVLESYRKNGELDNVVESESIDSLKVPEDVKYRLCSELIYIKRKEHNQHVDELQAKLTASLQFSVEDAAALLKAPEKSNVRLNLHETSGKIVSSFMPFNLFSMLKDEEIVEKIKETHDTLRTFRTKGQTVALLRMQRSVAGVGARRGGFIIRRQSSEREYDTLFKRKK